MFACQQWSSSRIAEAIPPSFRDCSKGLFEIRLPLERLLKEGFERKVA
jgi:hypothetical protein